MKLLNQKAKVTFYFIFFDRNQPMTQPSAGKKQLQIWAEIQCVPVRLVGYVVK